jgi:hypothetical protein
VKRVLDASARAALGAVAQPLGLVLASACISARKASRRVGLRCFSNPAAVSATAASVICIIAIALLNRVDTVNARN